MDVRIRERFSYEADDATHNVLDLMIELIPYPSDVVFGDLSKLVPTVLSAHDILMIYTFLYRDYYSPQRSWNQLTVNINNTIRSIPGDQVYTPVVNLQQEYCNWLTLIPDNGWKFLEPIVPDLISLFAPDVEVEARFGSIPRHEFLRLRTALRERLPSTIEDSVDYTRNGVRQTVRDGRTTQIIKESLRKHIFEEYEFRVNVSTERQTAPQEVEGVPPSFTRTKHRESFAFPLLRADLTEVKEQKEDKQPVNRYEVELELTTLSEEALRELDSTIEWFLKTMQETHLLYTLRERDQVIDDFHRLTDPTFQPKIGKALRFRLSRRWWVEARNLQRRDCVWGGLLGGKPARHQSRYYVAHKADGLRTVLYAHISGLYLISPYAINRLTTVTPPVGVEGIILDGEAIPHDKLIPPQEIPATKAKQYAVYAKTKNLFVPFDVVTDPLIPAIQRSSLTLRLSNLELVHQKLNTYINNNCAADVIAIYVKPFYALEPLLQQKDPNTGKVMELDPAAIVAHSQDQFRRLTSQIQPFRTDGFILTPNDAPYNPYFNAQSGRPVNPNGGKPTRSWKRQLSKYVDVCKFKPWEKLTIDFQYEVIDGRPTLLSSHEIKSDNYGVGIEYKSEPFRGDDRNPFDPRTQVEWTHLLFDEMKSGDIAEFGPIDRNGLILLQPVGLRLDKENPNRDLSAVGVWADINKPLTYQTLVGEDLALAIQEQNRMKNRLIETIPLGSQVIDIGAGRGGDIDKFKGRQVLAVEPDPNHRIEYERRLSIQEGAQIQLLGAGGEDTDAIVTAAVQWFNWRSAGNVSRPVYITMMLSLSFFFRDNDMLGRLVATVKGLVSAYRAVGGVQPVHFMYYTIDGEKLFARYDPAQPDWYIGTAHFMFRSLNEVYVNIPRSIVEHQTEYRVNLTQLHQLLDAVPFGDPIQPQQKYLSVNDLEYIGLFTGMDTVIGAPAAGVPSRTTGVAVPGRTAGVVVPGRTTGVVVPSRTAGVVVPSRTSGTAGVVVPSRTSGTAGVAVPGRTTGTVVPGRTTGTVVPGRTTGTVVPGRTAGAVVPGRTAGAVVPGRTAGAVVPGRTTGTVVPSRTAGTGAGRAGTVVPEQAPRGEVKNEWVVLAPAPAPAPPVPSMVSMYSEDQVTEVATQLAPSSGLVPVGNEYYSISTGETRTFFHTILKLTQDSGYNESTNPQAREDRAISLQLGLVERLESVNPAWTPEAVINDLYQGVNPRSVDSDPPVNSWWYTSRNSYYYRDLMERLQGRPANQQTYAYIRSRLLDAQDLDPIYYAFVAEIIDYHLEIETLVNGTVTPIDQFFLVAGTVKPALGIIYSTAGGLIKYTGLAFRRGDQYDTFFQLQ